MKRCPICGSTRLSINPAYGIRCNRCGWINRKGEYDAEFRIFKEMIE